ncbi:MAG: transcriptional regulatory protein [Ramlibacter sp.]|jgi:hypothetical protein|nr:transcriptional regulatory protein [Ramlibacter sp.]
MRIGLSQPAASHALQRLRDIFGDPLLVRVGARMELTPRAQALRGPQALDQVRGLFIPDDFDATSSERRRRLETCHGRQNGLLTSWAIDDQQVPMSCNSRSPSAARSRRRRARARQT